MTDLKGKTVILTGATGFLGRYAAQALLDAGAVVAAVVRPGSKNLAVLPEDPRLVILQTNLDHVAGAYRETRAYRSEETPYAFLHFAWGGVNRGEIDTDAVQQKNIELSLACLRAAKELGCTVFMDAGSRVEYGITEDGVMEESLPCHPVNAYGRAKLAFYEQAAPLAKEWGLTYYHLRFFSVYGRGDHPWSLISTLTRDLPSGKTVNVSACRHKWNFMEVTDAARAVVELLCHSDAFAGETLAVNVASADTRVLKDFVEEVRTICEESGKPLSTLSYGAFEQAKEGALSICPVIKELKRLTEGCYSENVSFREGIERLLESPDA